MPIILNQSIKIYILKKKYWGGSTQDNLHIVLPMYLFVCQYFILISFYYY